MNSPFLDDDNRAHPLAALAATATSSSLANLLVGFSFTLYVAYFTADLLGFPARRWLHRFLGPLPYFFRMAASQVPLLLPALPLSGYTTPDDDTNQHDAPKSPLSILSGAGDFFRDKFMGKPRDVPAGLVNPANSCYQNSIIQGLASLRSLHEYLSATTSEHSTLDERTTSGALLDLINFLNDPENRGRSRQIPGVLRSMSTWQQQDAQEYYSKVLDALDTEVKKASKSKRRSSLSLLSTVQSLTDALAEHKDGNEQDQTESDPAPPALPEQPAQPEQPATAPNPLDGLLAQRVGCVRCGHSDGLSLTPFNCLTVPLAVSDWGAVAIEQCLNEYTHLEYIEGVECAKCTVLKMEKALADLVASGNGGPFEEKLKIAREVLDDEDFDDKTLISKLAVPKKRWEQTTKSRQCVIARAPKCLAIHVNRSIFDERIGMELKNSTAVRYPPILDLGRWCLGSRPSNSNKVDYEEQWPQDPQQSMIQDKQADCTTSSPFQYALRAAVIHDGVHGYGHYVCYRPHPLKPTVEQNADQETTEEALDPEDTNQRSSQEQWWCLSDEYVRSVTDEEAQRQSNVFMLFYERIDADSSPFPPAEALPSQQNISTVAPEPFTALDLIDPAILRTGSQCAPDSPRREPEDPSVQTVRPDSPITDSTTTLLPSREPSPTEESEEAEMTEASDVADDVSEGAPSTNITSDDDVEMEDTSKAEPPASSYHPQLMLEPSDNALELKDLGEAEPSASSYHPQIMRKLSDVPSMVPPT